MTHLMKNYARQDISFTHGEGVYLYDQDNLAYLDALAGIAVNTLGHNHPRLTSALKQRISRLIHTSNLYRVPEQEQLANKIAELADLGEKTEVFFCNSGCEANEAAIKLARMYGHQQAIETPTIVVMENAFHGRTMATLSATGNRKVQVGFEPLVAGFVRIPYNDINALENVAAHNPNVVAVMFEVIQGEGGICLASQDFQSKIGQICQEKKWLMICDEVQCGLARTGKWFAFQHAMIKPDIFTLAKGLGSGVPIGACIASNLAYGLFKAGNHGSTFGGNPLACTAALTTIEVIESDNLRENALARGNEIRQGLAAALQGISAVQEIRGQGLMIGIELDRPCNELVALARAEKLLINVTHDKVIRLLPALILSAAEAKLITDKLAEVIINFING